jgi:hypothetical protein
VTEWRSSPAGRAPDNSAQNNEAQSQAEPTNHRAGWHICRSMQDHPPPSATRILHAPDQVLSLLKPRSARRLQHHSVRSSPCRFIQPRYHSGQTRLCALARRPTGWCSGARSRPGRPAGALQAIRGVAVSVQVGCNGRELLLELPLPLSRLGFSGLARARLALLVARHELAIVAGELAQWPPARVFMQEEQVKAKRHATDRLLRLNRHNNPAAHLFSRFFTSAGHAAPPAAEGV